jgi:hypothetical protein
MNNHTLAFEKNVLKFKFESKRTERTSLKFKLRVWDQVSCFFKYSFTTPTNVYYTSTIINY